MYTSKCYIDVIELESEIKIAGFRLQESGLPITFESLGKMWDRYTDQDKERTRHISLPAVEYGVCLNKVPDYIVGTGVTSFEGQDDFTFHTIPAGKYIKILFNGEDYASLVGEKLELHQKLVKKWAKDNKIKINGTYDIEVYPKESVQLEHPEMYCLYPIL